MAKSIIDQQERALALDPTQSFIIQAPAGSGKTELLSQRLLRLLSHVNHPEEIIAITFTRKAANEMRERVLSALRRAKTAAPEKNSHAYTSWHLAKNALARSDTLNWQLLLNPNRLRIITIDSLCASLARQLPIMAKFGSQPMVSESPQPLYQQAALQCLADLEKACAWSPAIAYLLQHLDNNIQAVTQLLMSMLAKRDQWLPHIIQQTDPDALRAYLERNLQVVIVESLSACDDCLDGTIQQQIVELISFARTHAPDFFTDWPIDDCFPDCDSQQLLAWQCLANLLLTKDGKFRKSVTKQCGFPSASSKGLSAEDKAHYKTMKQRMQDVLTVLADNDALLFHLRTVVSLPSPKYPEQQWQMLLALLELLPISVAHLHVIFQQHARVDFCEIAMRALEALGDIDDPSDLNLILDYKIQHILIDEFQDTSISQYHLLERLTAGWQVGDSRSVFLVGDPMQSIYRFRQAEVSLFLRTAEQGLAHIPLKFLRLKMNFRSQEKIITWLNTYFPAIFPALDNQAAGGISYTPSHAAKPALTDDDIHFYAHTEDAALNQQLIELIIQLKAQDETATIAILVKSRSHLQAIIPLLHQAQIAFDAIDIETLTHRSVIQDLLAICHALHHRADRIAWLSLLRAPFCGLKLADLLLIANTNKHQTIYDNLQHYTTLSLSQDANNRLDNFMPIVNNTIRALGRIPFSQSVKTFWLACGGPATVLQARDLNDAKRFFNLLMSLEKQGEINNIAELDERITTLYASNVDSTGNAVQIMTIHKAKGLEFDHVIIPSLARRDINDPQQLLLWMERPGSLDNDHDLLLAPIKSRSDSQDKIYAFLQSQEKLKQYYEKQRLLYVALTRAKKSLHLFACLAQEDGAWRKPSPQSFLGLLWPSFCDASVSQVPLNSMSTSQEPLVTLNFTRLAKPWQLVLNHTDDAKAVTSIATVSNKAMQTQESARLTGIIIHRLLQHICHRLHLLQDTHYVTRLLDFASTSLLQAGLNPADLSPACDKIRDSLERIRHDKRAQWLFAHYANSHSEYAITIKHEDGFKHYIIDRWFIDDSNTCWIIDYKTAALKPSENLNDFMKRQQEHYKQQLDNYADCLQTMIKQPISLGLYFPLVENGWCSWPYTNTVK